MNMVNLESVYRHWHIMLKFLPTILLSTAQNFYLLFPQSYLLFSVLFSKFKSIK